MKPDSLHEQYKPALEQLMALESKEHEFEGLNHFFVRLDCRLTAAITKQPVRGDYELVSLWIGYIIDARAGKGKKANHVPVFVREYIHLPANQESTDDYPDPSSVSTAIEEYAAYRKTRRDGFFSTPDYLLDYGFPFAYLRPSLGGCQFHVIQFQERRVTDRLVASPTNKAPTNKAQKEAFNTMLLDLGDYSLSQNGPFIERQYAEDETLYYLSLQLYPPKATDGIVRDLPANIAAKDLSESKRWFSTALALELSCQRQNPGRAARIWEWVKPLEQRIQGDRKREARLQQFKKDVKREVRRHCRANDDLKETLMRHWDELAGADDPVYEW